MQAARRAARQTTPGRTKMIAAIQITWRKLRPDLHDDPDELRAERLAYISEVLKLKHPLVSLTTLSTPQLARVLDALHALQTQPKLAGYTPPVKPQPASAEVIHFASSEQVFTIKKLFDFLNWSAEAGTRFLRDRFKRENPVHLRPPQAHSLIRILLNIACQRELKARGCEHVSRQMISAHIPLLKARLEIDRKEIPEEVELCQDPTITSAGTLDA